MGLEESLIVWRTPQQMVALQDTLATVKMNNHGHKIHSNTSIL